MRKSVRNTSRRLCLITVLIVMAVSSGCGDDTDVRYRDTEWVNVGSIVALSEASPIWGWSCLEALRCAEADVNADPANQNSGKKVRLIYGDSGTDPDVADALLESFINQGARAVIGPLTSSELLTMADTVNASDSIVISPSSTMSQLSVAGDNIFRMVPDDRLMIEAVVEALLYKGIRHLAVMYIDDEWGAAIFEDLSRSFEERGGTLLGSQNYLNLRPDILQGALDDLSGLVSDQMTISDPSTIGFMIICYDEGSGIIELAAPDPVLGAIRWFGTDGFANSRSLLENETAALFMVQTEYLAPSLYVPLTPEGEALKERIETATGVPATHYSLLAYDAFRTAAEVLLNASRNITLDDLQRSIFSGLESDHYATGNMALNETGDRATGTYYFYTVEADGGSYAWRHVLTWEDDRIAPAATAPLIALSYHQ